MYLYTINVCDKWYKSIVDIQEFYELALQDESHSVTDEDISIAQKYIMEQFDAKVGLVSMLLLFKGLVFMLLIIYKNIYK